MTVGQPIHAPLTMRAVPPMAWPPPQMNALHAFCDEGDRSDALLLSTGWHLGSALAAGAPCSANARPAVAAATTIAFRIPVRIVMRSFTSFIMMGVGDTECRGAPSTAAVPPRAGIARAAM